MIVAVPAATPVTVPDNEPIVAFALLLVHKPPPTPSDKPVVVPAHTIGEPDIGPGERLTVTVVLA